MIPVPSIANTLNSDSQQSVYESLKRLAALGAASKILIDLGIGAVPFGIAADGLGQDARFTYDKDLGLLTVPSVATALAAYTTGPFVRLDGTSPLSADWDAGNYRIDSRNSTRWFSVVAYGADPTGVNDSTAAIQAAITAAGAVKGTVYFPPGTYKVLSTLTITAQMTLRGDGAAASQLLLPTASDGIVITTISATQGPVYFYDLRFTANGTATAGAFIHTNAAGNFPLYVSGCMFNGHYVGILLNTSWASVIERNQFLSSVAASGSADIYINNNVTDQGDNLIAFNCFWSSNQINVHQGAGGGTRIFANKFVGPSAYSIFMDLASGTTSDFLIQGNSLEGNVTVNNIAIAPAGTFGNISIQDNEFEGTAGQSIIYIAPTAAGFTPRGSITGNTFYNADVHVQFNPGQAGGVDKWIISDNIFDSPTYAAIWLQATAANVTNLSVGRNTFIQSGTAPYVAGAFSSSSGFSPAIETVFSQTANSTTTANSPTTLLGTGKGSLTIPAGRLMVGTQIRLRIRGFTGTADGSAAAKTVTLYLGGTQVSTSTSGSTQMTLNSPWELEALITVRSTGGSGTVMGYCHFLGVQIVETASVSTSTVTINTTGGGVAVDVKYNNGNATGSLTTTEATVEILN